MCEVTESVDPSLVMDRRDKFDASEMKFNTLAPLTIPLPKVDKELPKRACERKLIAEPNPVKSRTDKLCPNLAKFLKLKLLPKFT
jgi:hypothetical protein